MGIKLIGGPCDGWDVDWMDSGPVAHFGTTEDPGPHAYYLAENGTEAVWQVDALRSHIDSLLPPDMPR